ncbi:MULTISPECIES: hypothetical protein [Streptacidiphilus]|uniref:Dynamin family protein n=1 Tax=Streptacidiphilus cavernicola TaxID=3342716 RepID=A0ABV6UUM5_9ACTN|nr:hypothetical protein [Streptacidiphilus jeojiense]
MRREPSGLTARPLPPSMPARWVYALSALHTAARDALGLPFGGAPPLPPDTAAQLRALLPSLREAPAGRLEYRVPLIAPMKAGKSTLINALLCQDLLPARGPAMTILPTQVVPVTRQGTPEPVLTFTDATVAVLADIAGRLAAPDRRSALAAAVKRSPQLAQVATAIGGGPRPAPEAHRSGTRAVRRGLAETNDLLRLALSVLQDSALPLIQLLRAPEVVVPVPWLEREPVGGWLVLVDTPGPDENLLPGVLNGFVAAEVVRAHELLLVADATRMEASAEASVARLVDEALVWPGRTGVRVVVNRVDMVPHLESTPAGRIAQPPSAELRSVLRRLTPARSTAERTADPADHAVCTAARQALEAATVLWPDPNPDPDAADPSGSARSAFLRTLFPLDADGEQPPARDPGWVRDRASDAWRRSGVPYLLDSFLGACAEEPGRMAVRVLLDRLTQAVGTPDPAVAVTLPRKPLDVLALRKESVRALVQGPDSTPGTDWSATG